jgi:IS5 family transposase
LDKGYDDPRCRRALRRRGITPRIARRGIESSQRLGRHRYVVERSLARLAGYRRLQVGYERRADILLALLHLACALICLKSLTRPTGMTTLRPGGTAATSEAGCSAQPSSITGRTNS